MMILNRKISILNKSTMIFCNFFHHHLYMETSLSPPAQSAGGLEGVFEKTWNRSTAPGCRQAFQSFSELRACWGMQKHCRICRNAQSGCSGVPSRAQCARNGRPGQPSRPQCAQICRSGLPSRPQCVQNGCSGMPSRPQCGQKSCSEVP